MTPDFHGLISRQSLVDSINQGLKESPATVLLGARQVGKTTLARQIAGAFEGPIHFFDLETETGLASLSATPELALSSLTGLVVIDEIQRLPKLFQILRPLLDRTPLPSRFLLLGSASPGIVRGVSESLAGRVRFIQIPGINLLELGPEKQLTLWLQGSFPSSLLVPPDSSLRWRQDFVRTMVEQDLPALGLQIAPATLRRFWQMLSHYHGQVWNGEELGRVLGVTGKTARHYLDLLEGTYLVRILQPWHANLGKRQVKAPRVYVRDSGLLHTFLGIQDLAGLLGNPKYGASWEGFALEQILSVANCFQPFFWSTSQGAEVDLILERNGRLTGVEFKCSDAPTMTKSMHIGLKDLALDQLLVVYPGSKAYALHEKVRALPLLQAMTELK